MQLILYVWVVVLGTATYLLVRRSAPSNARRASVSWIVTASAVLAATFATAGTELRMGGRPLYLVALLLTSFAFSATLSNVATSVPFSWRDSSMHARVSLFASVVLALAGVAALEFLGWFAW